MAPVKNNIWGITAGTCLVTLLSVSFSSRPDKTDQPAKTENKTVFLGNGQMPDAVNDSQGKLHVVYGNGDSILFVSSQGRGKLFGKPSLLAVLPKLAASQTRGPQIAVTRSGLTVIACNTAGDIFSFLREPSGKWSQAVRVNDVDTTAKEGLMALSGDGNNVFAVWLDLRDKHNKIFGAGSTDGGKTWSKNKLIYASPDSTVCECCKPSVVVKGNHVYVMFRNWLNGNRDLYLIESTNGGAHFGAAKKLGNGNWKINGCPMDGGGIAVQDNNRVQTVWRRQNSIFAFEPGKPEKDIGAGKGCALTLVNNTPVYTWAENGNIICLSTNGGKQILGKGRYPVIKPAGKNAVVCIWENEKHIEAQFVSL